MQGVGRLNPVLRTVAQRFPSDSTLRVFLREKWEWVLRVTQSDVQVHFHGRKFWVHSSWRSLEGNYETFAVNSLLQRLTPGDTFWDVGGHIGLYAMVAAQQVGEEGQVVVWEPAPQSFAHLTRHLALNRLQHHCLCFNEAVVDDSRQSVRFDIDVGNESSCANRLERAEKQNPARSVEVPAGHLDGWAEKLKRCPDVIKMDIEGAEIFALRGARKLLTGGYGKRPKILLSVHPASIHQYGSSCSELEKLVKSYGYSSYTLHGAASPDLAQFGEFWLIPD